MKSHTIKKETLKDLDTLSQEMPMLKELRPTQRRNLCSRLLSWYHQSARDLPWRESSENAYSIWVSEIMLQQTRVSTVCSYYVKWMKEFPDVYALAAATIDQVNSLWAGLGYYRRAALLHKGAQVVVEKYDGKLPTTFLELLKIPGIGKYTAGAIASIAFGERCGAVDGNVTRVLSRLCSIRQAPCAARERTVWRIANALAQSLPLKEEVGDSNTGHSPGDLNQALMELGATLCSSKSPSCEQCPISVHCGAYQDQKQNSEHKVTQYPLRAAKRMPRPQIIQTCVVQRGKDQYLLMEKRPQDGLLANFWQFPTVVLADGMEACQVLGKIDSSVRNGKLMLTHLRKLISDEEMTGSWSAPEFVTLLEHQFTHIRQTILVEFVMLCSEGVLKQNVEKNAQALLCWQPISQVKKMAISTGTRKVLQSILQWQKDRTSLNKRISKKNQKNVVLPVKTEKSLGKKRKRTATLEKKKGI